MPAIGFSAFEGFCVRDEVFEKERSDGYDAAERMQPAQQKRSSLASAQRSDARFDFGSDLAGSEGAGRRRCNDCSLHGPMCELKLMIIVLSGKGSQGVTNYYCE